jgi:hypothetical protein
VLNDHCAILTSPQFRTTLTALASLYLTNPLPGELLRLLKEIDEPGIETAFAVRHTDHQHRALLTAWINTPSGPNRWTIPASTTPTSPPQTAARSLPASMTTPPANTSLSST